MANDLETKEETVAVRTTPRLKSVLEKMAAAENRSLSNMAENLWLTHSAVRRFVALDEANQENNHG